jgi:hypothetical protein
MCPPNPGYRKRGESVKKIVGGIIFVIVLAVAIFALRGSVAHAEPPYDHFKSYNVIGPPLPAPIDVTLKDQFGTVQGVVEQVRMFSPPVEKHLPDGGVSPIIHPEYHLAWYPFEGTCQERTLLVTNQFGTDQEWVVKDPVYLLSPTWKLFVNGLPTGLVPPSGLDHYLCYNVITGPPVGLDGVILTDQFHFDFVTVGAPRVFCNPVDKIVPDDGKPIYDSQNHLACYDINPKIPPPYLEVWANDQFGDMMFVVLENEFLCVPSSKCPDIDGDGYIDINCGGDDCDDTDASINPAADESTAAGNCADGKDNDCDGLTDTDPECGGTCTASVVGATYEPSPVRGSSQLAKHLAYFLLPLGALFGLIIWRRKR